MGIFAIWAIFSGLLLSSVLIDSNDEASAPEDTDIDIDTDPVGEDPDILLDTGASFEQTENGVTLELGDDETGTLAIIHYTDYENVPDNPLEVDEARVYLVPEGVDWSNVSSDTYWMVPGAVDFDNENGEYDLAAFEERFGLELLGVVDLLGVPDATDDSNDRIGEITSNAEFETYKLHAQTIGDQLYSFTPDDDIDTGADTEIVLDAGAGFELTGDGVTLNLDDDETGSLAVIHYTDYDPHGAQGIDVARFYLVPEEVDWSGATPETEWEVPGADVFGGDETDYDLAAFEEQFGLELLGVVNLWGHPALTDDPNDRIGEITSNAPFETYMLRSVTSYNQVISFLPAEYLL